MSEFLSANKTYVSKKGNYFDYLLLLCIMVLLSIGIFEIHLLAPFLFPTYYVYVAVAILVFIVMSRIDFEILMAFSKPLYIVSVLLLSLPILMGELTRGTVRWIPIGSIAIQPSEIVRPFLILYFAVFLTQKELTIKRLIQSFVLLFFPAFLILIQPSLGVTALTTVGFVGVLLASTLNKKIFLLGGVIFAMISPIIWFFMADYQRQRIETFINPQVDPYGAGYNSIQSMIAVGSGKILGRGLGQGVQTQLSFLPEPHNDFIFSSFGEEMGFIGVSILILCLFVLLWRLVKILENAKNPTARAFVSGILLVLFVQIVFNIGMNMGLFPISGVPLPFLSAGGSSLIATMMGVSIAMGVRR